MANTIIEIAPRPASGTPHNVVLRAMAGATGSPAASYSLSSVNALRYTFTVAEALIGSWGYDVRDSGNTVIETGFVHIPADDTSTYYGGRERTTADAAKLLLDTAAIDSQLDTVASTLSSQAATLASIEELVDVIDDKVSLTRERVVTVKAGRGSVRPWDSLVDVRGLAEHWDASDKFTVLNAESADVRSNYGDTVKAWMGRYKGWRAVDSSASGPEYNEVSGIPCLSFGGPASQHRFEITNTAALDALRNKGYAYVFAVAKPAVVPGHSQTFLAVSTGASNSNARVFAYTNSSGRFNCEGRRLDADTIVDAFTNSGQYSGGWIVAVYKYEWADGVIEVQRDTETPAADVFASSGNTSDTRAITMRIGSGLGASFNNNLAGPITDLLLATPDTVYTDSELNAIVAGLASRKGITI
jgi:hypothetical protein